MGQVSKRMKMLKEKLDLNKEYSLDEAIQLLKDTTRVKFDESVEVACKLGVDPKKTEELVRGAVVLPYGIGKTVKVAVLTRGEEEKSARDAGADHIGHLELLEKIKSGWTDFDYLVATPDTMPEVAKLGKILGPKGLMPSPKTGTVTKDVGRVVSDLKKGRIDFKVDKTGCIHAPLGKISLQKEQLMSNFSSFFTELMHQKPQNFKGNYIDSLYLSTTMGPGLKLDLKSITGGRESK